MLLFSAAGAVLSYLLAREGGPLWDARFEAWDQALGFDWLAYARLIDSHSWIALPFRLAYASLIPQIIVLVLALGFTQRVRELRSVILAAMLCGTTTILLSPLFPAVSNFAHLGLSPADFRNIDPWAGYTHLADYQALRNGTMEAIDLPKMQGIITFPSYHAGLATVTLWGFLKSSSKLLRWSGAAVALTTIAATPVDGGHYLVDVIAGIIIALASIVAAKTSIFAAMQVPVKAWPFRRSRAAFAQ
jgi:membrane-associated phospholipid phosphatase